LRGQSFVMTTYNCNWNIFSIFSQGFLFELKVDEDLLILFFIVFNRRHD